MSKKTSQKANKRDFLKLYMLCKAISDLQIQVKFVVLLNMLILLIMRYNSLITHTPFKAIFLSLMSNCPKS